MVVDRLQDAATEGRLTLGEFSQRASRAYAARKRAELYQLVADLPTPRAVGRVSSRYISRRRALPRAALGIGIISILAGILLSWGLVLGLIGVLFGVFSLCAEGGLSQVNRRLSVAGIVCSLLTPAFFVTSHVVLGTLPG